MVRYAEAPRARRRRSCFPRCICCLALVWGVVMVGLHLARILASEVELSKVPKVVEIPKPPNYYQILGVTPLVSDEELKQLKQKFNLEEHPDKLGGSTEVLENYIAKSDIFNTLQNGKLRCEYDTAKRIKGKWQATTCKTAFQEEYREELLKEVEMRQAAWMAGAAAEKAGQHVRVKVKVEQQQEQEQERQQVAPEEPDPPREAPQQPQTSPVMPVVNVQVNTESGDRAPGVESIPGVEPVVSAIEQVWTHGVVHYWIILKIYMVDFANAFTTYVDYLHW